MNQMPNARVSQKLEKVNPYKNQIKNFMYHYDDKISTENLIKELPEM
jgi:hypothetical protein